MDETLTRSHQRELTVIQKQRRTVCYPRYQDQHQNKRLAGAIRRGVWTQTVWRLFHWLFLYAQVKLGQVSLESVLRKHGDPNKVAYC